MSKHTPGPWESARNNSHRGSIATIHGCSNKDWVEVWSPNMWGPEEVNEANARLIAAAPELLEALKTCVNVLTEPGIMDVDEWKWLKKLAVQDARDAISKAEGVTHVPDAE